MYDPEYLRLARDLCDRYRVHLVADEIAVGCGRSGTFFACEQAGIWPDFLCLSKGLTGGTLALSAVLTTTLSKNVVGLVLIILESLRSTVWNFFKIEFDHFLRDMMS